MSPGSSPPQLSAVQRRALDSESGWRGCERELTAQLQEARGCEKKLQDEARNLCLRAQAAQESASQAGLQLSEAQGRLAATEAELTRAEAGRRDLEFRLGSLQSALTRTLGIGAGRRVSGGGGGGGGGGRGRSPGGSSPGSSTISRHSSVSPLRSSLSPRKGQGSEGSHTNVVAAIIIINLFKSGKSVTLFNLYVFFIKDVCHRRMPVMILRNVLLFLDVHRADP